MVGEAIECDAVGGVGSAAELLAVGAISAGEGDIGDGEESVSGFGDGEGEAVAAHGILVGIGVAGDLEEEIGWGSVGIGREELGEGFWGNEEIADVAGVGDFDALWGAEFAVGDDGGLVAEENGHLL